MISADQRRLYWANLNQVFKNVGSSDPLARLPGEGPAQGMDQFRKDFHAQHNLPASTKDFTKAHMDAFLAACAAILKPADLKPQLRAFDQPKARLLHKILVEQAAQLKALGKADPAITIGQISVQKFHGRHYDQLSANKRPPRSPSPLAGEGRGEGYSELSANKRPPRSPSPLAGEGRGEGYSELEMLMFTVARTISELRQTKGWTVHELLWNSGLGKTCACADCKKGRDRARLAKTSARTAPELVTVADNVPF
jgi:hypothetical protein